MKAKIVKLCCILVSGVACVSYAGNGLEPGNLKGSVDSVVLPVLKQYAIPGMAIAVTYNGHHYFYNYGITSKKTQQPITENTLFEIGSLSKTLTATLASYAQVTSRLSFSDSASKYLPALHGSTFDAISLLSLGTHTSGLPLFVPENIHNKNQLMDYYKNWKPTYTPGTHRTYSNLGIGLLGKVTAEVLDQPFDLTMEKRLFPALGMKHSYINVPANQMKFYAQGYTKKDEPIRLNVGVLASEAYGVKSCTADLIRFIDANMQQLKLDKTWQQAIDNTHIGYFKSGNMMQGLMWEHYDYPLSLKQLLDGNSPAMILEPSSVKKLNPPKQLQADVLVNKTGSTNGFSAYAAFIPSQKLGAVILANKSYPIDQRVTLGYQILTTLHD
ncbi:class C beta-lactamase [Zooshikella sp. RANM57]|uniref:class C beta-lactamase n=1 Tax=Zooshikella sp. RANM57 TaxID=3425863 RepID=UPI003D6E93EC